MEWAIIPPDVDSHPGYLLSWEYPQFLADWEALCERNREYIYQALAEEAVHLTTYALGTEITYKSGLVDPVDATRGDYLPSFSLSHFLRLERSRSGQNSGQSWAEVLPREIEPIAGNAALVGWAAIEENRYRWSQCREASVIVALGDVDASGVHVLEVWAGSYGEQIAIVYVNGVRVGRLSFSGAYWPAQRHTVEFPGHLLHPDRYNEIMFVLPDATKVDRQDPRYLGLAFSTLRISQDPLRD